MRLSRKGQVALVRLAYLAPMLIGIAYLVLAFVPRFFYMLEGNPQSDISLFWLLGNTVENCVAFFKSEETRVPAEFYFSLAAFIVCILSWLCILLYAIFAVFTALLTVCTWNGETSPTVNTLKRYFRLFIPNRVCYVIMLVLPVLPSLFPYILQGFYGSIMMLETPVFYYGIPDPIIVGVLIILSALPFLLSLSAQEALRMDMFKLYKPKK